MTRTLAPARSESAPEDGVPGPASRALRAREDAHIAPGLQGYAVMAGIAVDHAVGSAVTDVDGNTFLDFIGGIGVNALGHAHPRVVDAIQDQVARAHVGSFTSEARVELVERVAAHAPAPGRASPAALLGGRRGRRERAPPRQEPHGEARVRLVLGRLPRQDDGRAEPDGLDLQGRARADGTRHAPRPVRGLLPLPHRLLVSRRAGSGAWRSGASSSRWPAPASIAAVVVEPMQGTAGNVVPPDDFLPAVQSLAKELDALLIADEMITGFGRTGRWWGVEHSGAVPDIVTIGKAFGGGFPLSGLAHARRHRGRQALERAERLVLELRRQPSRRPRPGAAALARHRGGASRRERARGRREHARRRSRPSSTTYPVRRRRARPRSLPRDRARSRQEDQGAASRDRSRGGSSTSA